MHATKRRGAAHRAASNSSTPAGRVETTLGCKRRQGKTQPTVRLSAPSALFHRSISMSHVDWKSKRCRLAQSLATKRNATRRRCNAKQGRPRPRPSAERGVCRTSKNRSVVDDMMPHAPSCSPTAPRRIFGDADARRATTELFRTTCRAAAQCQRSANASMRACGRRRCGAPVHAPRVCARVGVCVCTYRCTWARACAAACGGRGRLHSMHSMHSMHARERARAQVASCGKHPQNAHKQTNQRKTRAQTRTG